jgi:hypothetical protein
MAEGNGSTPAAPAPPYRLDRKSGEVVLTIDGVDHPLRPTMEATEEVEAALDRGIDAERTRLACACQPYAEQVMATPNSVPSTAELARIFAAGSKAAGRPVSVQDARRLIWSAGRLKVVGALWELVSAMADGGRLRADDLGNAASPSGSRPGPNGEAGKAETADQITAEIEAGLHSGATSD